MIRQLGRKKARGRHVCRGLFLKRKEHGLVFFIDAVVLESRILQNLTGNIKARSDPLREVRVRAKGHQFSA